MTSFLLDRLSVGPYGISRGDIPNPEIDAALSQTARHQLGGKSRNRGSHIPPLQRLLDA